MFTKWIYLCSLIGGCLEKLAGWERMAGESNFSASAGVLKRKAELPCHWHLGAWRGRVNGAGSLIFMEHPYPEFLQEWLPQVWGAQICPSLQVLPGGDVCARGSSLILLP